MPKYSYNVLTVDGTEKSGSVHAQSIAELAQNLSANGMLVLDIKPDSQRQALWQLQFKLGKISLSELADFTQLLASLVDAALPIDEALLTLAQHTNKKRIKRIVHTILKEVSQGLSLGQAMASQPTSFPTPYVATVNAGEQSGQLIVVLNRLSAYLEQQVSVRRQVQAALLYPTIIFVVAFSVVALLMTFVVPKILVVINNTDQELPLLTRGLVQINDWLLNYGWSLPWLIILVLIFILSAVKNAKIRHLADRLVLCVPLLGDFIKRVNSIYFCRSLAMLDASGVPIMDALPAASSVMNNSIFKNQVIHVMASVGEGMSLHSALAKETLLPDIAMRLIASGEKTGRLSQMLDKAATLIENQQQAKIRIGLTLLEPLIMVLMGGLVMLIVLAVLMPIFNMNQMAF
jgi:general secretion pathway protein F